MNALRLVLAELVGLFVDDGALALALVLWCAAIGAAVALAPSLGGGWGGIALGLGCVAILAGNVLRAAPRPPR